MDKDRYTVTIIVHDLVGKKSTSKGTSYWEVKDKAHNKYRLYDEGLYNRLTIGESFDVEVSDYSGEFVNEKNKTIQYTIKTIHNILTVPLDEDEPLDKVLSENKTIDESFTKAKESKPQDESPDWDAIARGKVRHGVAVAVIQQQGLVKIDKDMKELMSEWADWIMDET